MMESLPLLLPLCILAGVASALAAPALPPIKAILVTGANKGQGLALCERILTEHDDTRVFLCSRNVQRGEDAAASLRKLLQESKDGHGSSATTCSDGTDRVNVIQLDVTSAPSVSSAVQSVRDVLGPEGRLYGMVSNAGVLWGYPLSELMDVCATGVRRVLDGFLPLMEDDGRVVVVTSGLGPLMHGYASEEKQKAMMDSACTWEGTLEPMIQECLDAYDSSTPEDRPSVFETIGFPGGPFADTAPDFHMYGLAKMFGDAYMLSRARSHPNLRINSCDPGLVYTDIILKMPKYEGKDIDDTGAQTPHQGVEAAMRLLVDKDAGRGVNSGRFYAMSKDKTQLLNSNIDKMPNK